MYRGRTNHGLSFIVQHNGLQPAPDFCPGSGMHPIVVSNGFHYVGSGCPNKWVLEQSQAGQVTGFQVVAGITNLSDLESAFTNEWDNSDGIFLEIYQANALSAIATGLPSGRTLGDWNEKLHQRRQGPGVWTNVADPFPLKYQHSFVRTATNTSEPQVFNYVDPALCQANGGTNYGVVALYPDLSFTSIIFTNSNVLLTLGAANSATGRVEYSTNLVKWTTLQNGLVPGGLITITDAAPSSVARYYRAVQLRP